ncbi:lanthionine synthetase LanC family protein [Promicromonospora sp. NFX87]|uniref:lanthionine synthetase LanC family protein n=1 Tax=Promicromonospora sp. NFX87 TaxID=3402691 RepID=UPI003AFB3658
MRKNRTPLIGRRTARRPFAAPARPAPNAPTTSTATSTTLDDVGPALLAVELALTGDGPWSTALTAIKQIPTGPDATSRASLFLGAPAAAFALDAAAADGYLQVPDAEVVDDARRRQSVLDGYLLEVVEQRLAGAAARAQAGRPPTSAELGLTDGILGLGVLLLRRAPGSELMQQVIDYIVGLTRPVLVDGVQVPGWYVHHAPAPGEATPGGHVNLTMASGAAGLLAFLATCVRAGYSLESLRTPLQDLLDWFVTWKQPPSAEWPDSVWWPRWVTPSEVQTGHMAGRDEGEALPSWSRVAGMARAVQMGAGVLAEGRHARSDEARKVRMMAEEALLACLTDRQVRRLGGGLWGGLAGLYQTGHRAAAEAVGPMEIRLKHRMSAVGDALRAQVAAQAAGAPDDLWSGRSGLQLAAQTLRRGTAPTSRWDACLLITGNPRPAAPRSGTWS